MKKSKWALSTIIMLSLLIGGGAFISTNTPENGIVNNTDQKKNKKTYEYTFPERTSKNDSFKGEFISNDIASIYPRRDALVRDILVDIGDEVKAGDTLALLFNPGVGGEGQSKIKLKDTVVSTKYNLLSDVKSVKNAKVSEIDAKIYEKEIIISETIKSFDSQITKLKKQIADGEVKNNSISSLNEKIYNSKNNIFQKEELLNIKTEEVFHNIIPIFYIGNEDEIDYDKINTHDLSDIFGAKNSGLKNSLLETVVSFQSDKGSLNTSDKHNELTSINNNLIEVLKNTIISVDTTETQVTSYINLINQYNSELSEKKESYDDAINNYNILLKSEEEKTENLVLELAKLKTNTSLQLETLKASLETLKKSKNLLIANENISITTLKNEIAVANADLNSEYIKSGDYKIISPFSGVISKRGIEVGEKISPNMEAFRLTGVDTTLSRITKKEVKFYVPENVVKNLGIGKEIVFSLGDKIDSSFTGTIYRISPEIDEETFSITVQARVDANITLPNKSTLRVNLETKKEVFKIPSSSVYNKVERKIVYYKKENGKLGIRDVNIVSDDGEYSLVTGSFDETLKVVTTPIFIK
ncbi:HlyD family efflux transporter periplasmic adaptor subunit [Candidatus Gracilibacteria bacterium 28_42_T64]|nr:HlyD family efflux transporter periplasmic adaptor subunit [Candidatus Gracilibacteria bacterium 28_42_T64]